MKSGTVRGAATIIVAALAFTACIPETEGKPAAERAATPLAGARAGGRLVAGTGPIGDLDPALAVTQPQRLAASLICDTLVSLDPVTGEAKPAIAASWTVSGRGTKLFLRLRRGVRFHNGRELVAEDVAWSLTRLASEDLASDAAPLLRMVAGYEQVHGDAETDDDRFRRRLVGIQIIDPHNLEITLSEAFSDFVRTLAHPATAPVPKEAASSLAQKPVCTGPYRLNQATTPGEAVTLTRFDRYYARNQAYTRGGRGWADEIVLQPFPDRLSEQKAVEAVTIDVGHRGEGTPQPSTGVTQVQAPTAQVEYIGLPTTTPPFNDPGVRTAMAVALDRAAITAKVWNDARTPALSFVPDALSAAHRTGACPALQPSGNTAEARRMLQRTGVDLRGMTVSLYFNDEHRNRALAQEIAGAWSFAFGLTVQPVALTWGRFLELGTRPSGFGGVFRFGWAPAVASPDAVLHPLFHADSVGRDNLSVFGSRDVADAIRDARRAAVDEDRLRAYRRAEDLICRAMPMIPIAVAQRRVLIGPRIVPAIAKPLARSDGEVVLRELYVEG